MSLFAMVGAGVPVAGLTQGNVMNETFTNGGTQLTWTTTSSPADGVALLGSPIAALGSYGGTSTWAVGTTRPSAYWDKGAASSTTTYFRFFFYISAVGLGSTDYATCFAVGETTDPLSLSQAFSLNVLDTSGTYGVRVNNGSTNTAIQNISTGTWYRIEVKWISNSASCLARIYTASTGVQIGTDTTFTSSATQNFRYIHRGTLFCDNTKGWTVQHDGFGADTTNWLGQ